MCNREKKLYSHNSDFLISILRKLQKNMYIKNFTTRISETKPIETPNCEEKSHNHLCIFYSVAEKGFRRSFYVLKCDIMWAVWSVWLSGCLRLISVCFWVCIQHVLACGFGRVCRERVFINKSSAVELCTVLNTGFSFENSEDIHQYYMMHRSIKNDHLSTSIHATSDTWHGRTPRGILHWNIMYERM